jgi:hypothetical protein
MDPAIYVLIFAMAALLIVALILSNNASGGAVMPHPVMPRHGPYWEHGGQPSGSGMLY